MDIKKIVKKLIGIIIFLAIVFVPACLILLFIPDNQFSFDAFVLYFGIVIFSIFGYIVVSVRAMSKELHEAVESMKMQNAAIAYKLTNGDKKGKKNNDSDDMEEDKKEKVDISKVNLNPETPLVPDKNKNNKNNKNNKPNNMTKKIDDNFDDFK